MLCGRLPFDDDHIPLLFKKINGGIFSIPPFVSPEARQLLTKMLLVDSNKRIKLHEIRQLPWFQKDLAPYLFAPTTGGPRPQHDDEDGEGDEGVEQAPWTPEAPKEGEVQRRREWVEGLGVVDQEIVDDLCGKIAGLKSEDVWTKLQGGEDRELRIAYQLCRDNKRMVEGSHYDDTEAIQSFYAPPGMVSSTGKSYDSVQRLEANLNCSPSCSQTPANLQPGRRCRFRLTRTRTRPSCQACLSRV